MCGSSACGSQHEDDLSAAVPPRLRRVGFDTVVNDLLNQRQRHSNCSRF